MRLALLALLLLAGPVAAQANATEMRVAAEPPSGPITPLATPVILPVTITVPCALLAASPTSTAVHLAPGNAPRWAQVTVSPATLTLPPCAAASVNASAHLIVGVTAQAPALTPTPVEVVAWLDHPTGNRSARDAVAVEAAYFPLLDAVAEVTQQVGVPQSQLTFPLRIVNMGNGPTQVHFSVEGPAGWQAVAPSAVALDSAAAGGTRTNATALVMIGTPGRTGYANEVAAFTVTVTSAYALDAALQGDSRTLSLLATVKGFQVPAAGLALAVLATALAGLLRRR